MCGIVGFLGQNERVLQRMVDALQHRGPDGEGVYSDALFSMGMRRLAIIDLDGGMQPIWNETGDLGLICNGEIYNYLELRAELKKKNHIFKTNSDAEVILHLYEEYGADALMRLKGMFAFCIYDQKSGNLFLARDRFGEKPLFYCQKDQQFVFSSEMAALLEHPDIERRLNQNALPDFLEMGWVPEPHTLLQHVYSLPPGHYLEYENGQLSTTAWFSPGAPQPIIQWNEQEAVAQFQEVFFGAVERQLRSDVPVGVLLSGGLDSSSVVAAMCEMSDQPVHTFHVRFEEEKYNESPVAAAVARHFGTHHQEITLKNKGFEEATFQTLLERVGLPFCDAAIIPLHLICQEVQKEAKVLFTGDGGDELLGGYAYFLRGQRIGAARKWPRPLLQLLKGGVQVLSGWLPEERARLANKGLEAALATEESFFRSYFGLFSQTEVAQLLRKPLELSSPLLTDDIQTAPSFLRKMMAFSTKYPLALDMLVKTDRASMANSVETRTPFLDPEVYQFAASLPDNFLIREGKGKWILREMMKDRLPKAVLAHPKTGFTVPLHTFFNREFESFVRRTIHADHPLSELIDIREVERYIEQGLHQKTDTATVSVFRATAQLWLLVQLFAWMKRFNVQL